MYLENVGTVIEIAEEFKKYSAALSDFEATQLALTYMRNEVEEEKRQTFEKAFAVSPSDSYPPALEAIAIQLGFRFGGSTTIPQAIESLKV